MATGTRTAVQSRTSTRFVDPIVAPGWTQLVEKASGSLFHSPGWMRAIKNTYGFEFTALLIEQDGEPVAGVAWSDLDDIFGKRRITVPFSDFCDALGETPQLRAEAVVGAMPGSRSWLLRSTQRNAPGIPENSAARVKKYNWHVIDMTPSEDEIWNAFSSACKRNCRKAERNGLTTYKATTESELRAWFDLHLGLRRSKHGLLAQPYQFFKEIWDEFIEPGNGFLLLASHNDEIVAGTVYLNYGDTCYYKFNASHPEYLSARPNNALTWKGIKEARKMGLSYMDLGRSPVDSDGLSAFKRGFGAREDQIAAITFNPGVEQPVPAKIAARLLPEITDLFTDPRVPDEVTEAAGDLLYRFFA